MSDNEFKRRIELSESEKKRNELSEFILLPSKRELTQEEKARYLALDRSEIPSNMLYAIWCMGKMYILTGKVDEELFMQCMKGVPKKVRLSGMKEEWEQLPDEWKKNINKIDEQKDETEVEKGDTNVR